MILLKNGTYIDWQTLSFVQADILIEQGNQGNIHLNPLPNNDPNIKVIDCTGKYITKSFACGHHHVYSALARGMYPPRKNPDNFLEILKYIWWTLDKSLDLEMIRASALVTAVACAKNGVTFVIDHHASPFAVENSLVTIAQAFEEVGVGHLLCYEISDRDGMPIAEKGLAETQHYLSSRQGLVGLHASFTVGDQTLRNAVDMASLTQSGIHIHVAEDQEDQNHCMKHYGMRVIERLAEVGVLNFSKTILGHCLHLNDNEREMVAQSQAWIVQNTESNLNNQVGSFQSYKLGDRLMLGTDGMHSDMLRSAKAAFFHGQQSDNISYPGVYQRFRNVHHYLQKNQFSGDGDNNLVVLDYDTPTPFQQDNFLGHFVFGIDSKHIQHVISNGKLVVENGRICHVNEADILEEARIQAVRLWKSMQKMA